MPTRIIFFPISSGSSSAPASLGVGTAAIKVTTFLTAALTEIRVARAGDVVEPDMMDLALVLFNELLDAWNAEQRALYTGQFVTDTLTPALQPHTIGAVANTPTIEVGIARPSQILAANLLITAADGNIRIPLTLRDEEWWMDVRARNITSAIPTDLYYSPDWPNGSIYLWPVPSAAYGIELNIATLLSQMALTDDFSLPPGYLQALRLTTAERLAPSFGQSVSQSTAQAAREARARVFGNNDTIPNLNTRDAGMPGGRSGGYNFLTGGIE